MCLLVGQLFWDQLKHDDFHPGADRIYRVTTEMQAGNREIAWPPSGLVPVLRDRAASVDAATRLKETERNVMVDEQGYRAHGLYAELSFFGVFDFDLVAGNEETVLADPRTTVLT